MTIRGVEERLAWFLGNKPAAAGRCAEHVMHALNAPVQHLPDATSVARVVQQDRHMNHGPVPKGAIRYWDQGSAGHGHVGIEFSEITALSVTASVDVGGGGTVGVRDFGWFAREWPQLRYLGWSWWWGAIDTEPKEIVVTVPAYRNIKVSTPQTITLNQWTVVDLGPVDAFQPPEGSDDWWFQVHLSLASATCARNDLRYVKGRWARLDPDSPDANAQGTDTHGTDTAAISADIPKDSWQSSFSTDMKGEAGVKVRAEVYVGAMSPGTIVSPLRVFTIDDEST
jgi:hypothetical protein